MDPMPQRLSGRDTRTRPGRRASPIPWPSCLRLARSFDPRDMRWIHLCCSVTTASVGRGSRSTSIPGCAERRRQQVRMTLNETHDAQLASWIESANSPGSDFPIQNLPLGVFRRAGSTESFRGGVAIGDQILDLAAALTTGAFRAPAVGKVAGDAALAAAGPVLNELMAAGREASSALRLALSRALRRGSPQEGTLQTCLVPQAEAEYALPARIGDYTDFYTSIHHATAVGRLLRPDNPLLPKDR